MFYKPAISRSRATMQYRLDEDSKVLWVLTDCDLALHAYAEPCLLGVMDRNVQSKD